MRLIYILFCLFGCLHEKSEKSKQTTQIILDNFDMDIERYKIFGQSGVSIVCCRNFLIAKNMIKLLHNAEFGIIQKI